MRQIAELQTVAAQNDAHIRELAEQLQRTVALLEQATAAAETRSVRLLHWCQASIGVSVLAIVLALVAMLAR